MIVAYIFVIKITGYCYTNLTNRWLKKLVQYVIIIMKQDKSIRTG